MPLPVNGVLIARQDAQGNVAGYGKIMRDRTDVRAQIETLESRAEALAKTDARKNLFLRTLAHELRNPLAPLVHALRLIPMAEPVDEKLVYPLKLIEGLVELIRRLVDDQLDISRFGAGKGQLKRETVQLNDI